MALQVLLGTARWMEYRQMTAREVCDIVATAKGTTERGIAVLQRERFSGIVQSALEASRLRSKTTVDTPRG